MVERVSRRGSATDRLQRILYLLPAATAADGASIDGLCDQLGVTREVLLEDLREVTEREYYHPAGSGDRLRVMVERDRVRVATTGEFRRPPRLSPRERLALDLGLRVLAAEREGEARASLLELAGRLEAGLASVPEIEFAPEIAIEEAAVGPPGGGASADAPDPSEAADPLDPAAAGVVALRGLLSDAARQGRRCAIRYVKAGADAPEDRAFEPYAIVASAGRWYAVGRDVERDAVRAFRVDRMLEARVTDEPFERDPSFDPEDYLTGAYVYRPPGGAATAEHAVVRYAPSIARWFLERGEGRQLGDGSAVVEHSVSDPGWAARHVLQYGGEAELLGPADLRARVAEGARRAERAHAGA